jgi:hypothetical protein
MLYQLVYYGDYKTFEQGVEHSLKVFRNKYGHEPVHILTSDIIDAHVDIPVEVRIGITPKHIMIGPVVQRKPKVLCIDRIAYD